MKITEETMEAMTILYRRRIGNYGSENKKMMASFKKWIRNRNLVSSQSTIVAVIYDDPSSVRADLCRYEVGLVVDASYCSHDIKTLATGMYLIFEIDHTELAIQRCWENIPREMGLLGYEMNPHLPVIERYRAMKIRSHRCEICVPIQ